MEKRVLSVLLVLCLLIGCLPMAASAEGSTGSEWSYDETTKTLTVTKQGRLTGGYYDWNAIRAEVENVVLADGITEIGSEAFEGFTSLTEVILPDTVTEMDDKVFVDCVKLSHVVIPASVTRFADSADAYFIGFGMPLFWNCPLLITAGPIGSGCNIEFGWTDSIPASAFLGCDSLQSVTLPEGIERIGDGAFGFTDLSSVTLPNSVKVLEDYAFLGCRRLTQVNIPAGVLRLGTESGRESSVFTECARLTAITVDSANPSYSDREGVLFSKDGKKLLWCPPTITEYDIPEGVTAIAGHAFTSGVVRYSFEARSNLTRVTIPSTVTEICGGAFSNAAGLTEVTIPENVKTIGNGAFSGCTGLTEAALPESVETIGSGAFSGCTGLTSVTVPAGVTGMGFDVFADCASLTEAVLLGGGDSLTGTFTNCAQLETVNIRGSVEELSDTFKGCGKLKNVFLPASLTNIYRDTFGDCLQLATVTYAGTQAQWDLIGIDSGNEPLTHQAQIVCTGVTPPPTPTPTPTATPTPTPKPVETPTPAPNPPAPPAPGPVEPDPTNSPTPSPSPAVPKFVDVPAGEFYTEAVQWAVQNGITAGTDATHFSPKAACTRAQAVTFLWRAAGEPKASGSASFSDVPSNSWYGEAVKWAVAKGVTSGTGNGKFSPDAICDRSQIVTFLWRAEGRPSVSGGTSFSDVNADSFYATAVQWAVRNRITSGTGKGNFSPAANCDRGQIVTFLYRYSN